MSNLGFNFKLIHRMIGSSVAPVTRVIGHFGKAAARLPSQPAAPITTAAGGTISRIAQRIVHIPRHPAKARPMPVPRYGGSYSTMQAKTAMATILPLIKKYLAQGMPYYQAFNQARKDAGV